MRLQTLAHPGARHGSWIFRGEGGLLMLIGVNVILVTTIAVSLSLYMLKRRTRIIKARFERAAPASPTA